MGVAFFHRIVGRSPLGAVLSLFGTTVVIAAVALGFWQFSTPRAEAGAKVQQTSQEVQRVEPFSIRGMTLGMSAKTARGLYPRMAVQWQGDGSYSGKFVADGRTHTISFAPGRDPGAVVLISYREMSPRLSSDKISARFRARFGIPKSVDCGQGLCAMKWWITGGAEVTVRSRNQSDVSGRLLTVLTVTATDAGASGGAVAIQLAGDEQPM